MTSIQYGLISLVFFVFSPTISFAELGPQQGYFQGELMLLDVAENHVHEGDFDPGHTEFQLVKEYAYVDGKGNRWVVPKNTVVNGASIPKVVWSAIGGPWSGKYRNAAVIHDWMCEEQVEDSSFVHRIFHEAMLDSGVDEKLAWIMYKAVDIGGPKWIKSEFSDSPVQRSDLTEEQLKVILKEADEKFD